MVVSILTSDNCGGGELGQRTGPIGGEPMLEALEGFRPLEVVVETCPFWPWIHDVLEPTEIGFHLAHASKLEAIAKAETKTDSVDARLLARMLAANLIPEVYPKPAEQREIVHCGAGRAADGPRVPDSQPFAPAGAGAGTGEAPRAGGPTV